MADMILEYRVMPESGDIEYSELEAVVKKTVQNYKESITIHEVKEEPVGFGLKAVIINFQIDENYGSEELENTLADLEEVGEVQVVKMDRL